MSIQSAISVQQLSKFYRDIRAVDGINFNVQQGEIYGFLGRNGAGKTTSIRMLLGLVRPSAGEVSLFGEPITPGKQSVYSRVGYLVETATAYPNLTVRENLEIQRRLTNSPYTAVGDVIDLLGLKHYTKRLAGRLSLGNKQRLALARALLHRPQILILDEPINGLDPAGIVEVRTLLRQLADQQGVTVFISSHILSEIEHLVDRVGIIRAGRMVKDIRREEFRTIFRSALELSVSDIYRAQKLLAENMGLRDTERSSDGSLRVFDAEDREADIARVLVQNGIGIFKLCPVREDLEDYFLRLTEDEA